LKGIKKEVQETWLYSKISNRQYVLQATGNDSKFSG